MNHIARPFEQPSDKNCTGHPPAAHGSCVLDALGEPIIFPHRLQAFGQIHAERRVRGGVAGSLAQEANIQWSEVPDFGSLLHVADVAGEAPHWQIRPTCARKASGRL